MNNFGGIIVVCFTFFVAVSIGLAVGALVAWLAMLLWNFIVVSMQHPEIQVSFWVAWAVIILLGIIARPFRSISTKSS